ncbi:hypothetical protein E4U43_004594 [Claviceps pusilla]|uniref:Counting factor 60 n=1 Tax=Claviceps pusilla TaxID=123648 RepID=A0A9P7NJ43_9HYPO|nr:hypothetical protein E4U43_004594 [Claviceps pusilla]
MLAVMLKVFAHLFKLRAKSTELMIGVGDVDTSWYAPAKGQVNNLRTALSSQGMYGFTYNSSDTPDTEYGKYNWCNMPHVRPREYVRPDEEFELQYVELIHRHHKRTPYASNAFPIEPYQWNCDDAHLFLFGKPLQGNESASVFRQGYTSPINPFIPGGWIGSCAFPQITAGGLQDSWQHGADLYAVYHGLLGFLPAKHEDYRSVVRYRVTNNIITSQVAGMVIDGMWSTGDPFPLLIQASCTPDDYIATGVDSLEPQYACSKANSLFNSIKSNSKSDWKKHLELTGNLFHVLDDISGVLPDDDSFHASFDHYYDNLSARQCHDRPLPCKLNHGQNSTSCVTQNLANFVYRIGNWEYSHIYRDHPSSLSASSLSFGVWIGELTNHLRDVMNRQSKILYFHNVAHDGSIARLLSILQIDEMVWPGMGSEVVFELYRRKSSTTRAIIQPTLATRPVKCPDEDRLSSACLCLSSSTNAKAAPTVKENAPPTLDSRSSGFYVRVLFGGKIFKSSNPSLGSIDMLPAEVLLDYLDGLVGKDGNLVESQCQL